MTARLVPLALLAALAVGSAGCDQVSLDVAPPLDRTFFPTGIALHRLADGRTALVVANSNFDLTYARDRGGTLVTIDPAASADGALPVVLGGTVIDSFAGEVAVADPATCPGLPNALALVPTRFGNAVHAVAIAADGALDCGPGCRIDLAPEFRSPFSVTTSCDTQLGARAWVSHLEARPDEDGLVRGWVSEIDLGARAVARTISLGPGRSTVRTVRWDGPAGRLYATPVASTSGFSAFRWIYPTGPFPEGYAAPFVNFDDLLRNGVAQDVALSSDRRRLYVTSVLNDPSFLSTAGLLVPVSGALAVLELVEGARGDLGLRLLRAVPLGLGPGSLLVVPRAGRGDLVVVADTSGNDVFVYDDDAGAVVRAFGRDETPGSRFAGRPIAGRQPFGLAAEPVPGTGQRIYVGSFGEGIVTVIDLDPDAPHAAQVSKRIGVRP